MLKKIFFAIVFQGSAMLLALSPADGFAQEGVLRVEVTDSLNGMPLEMVTVVIENAGSLIDKGLTDDAGVYIFKNLAPGNYDVKIVAMSYPKRMFTGVLVRNNETTYLDGQLSSGVILDGFVKTEYKKPLIEKDCAIRKRYDYTDIKTSAVDPTTLINSSGTETKPGMSPSFRGARQDANVYIIDGMRVIGSANLPKNSIQQISVTLGGVPAMYGDGTGAFIEIETRSGLVNPNNR